MFILTSWSQALNNEDSDTIVNKGYCVINELEKQGFVQGLYSKHPSQHKVLTEKLEVRRKKPNIFIIEIIGEEKDNTGRESPIVFWGEFPKEINKEWCETLYSEIEITCLLHHKRTIPKSTKKPLICWLLNQKSLKAKICDKVKRFWAKKGDK